MRKFLLCCLACLMLTGCTQTKPDASSDVLDTLGSQLVNQFQKHAKEESDPMEIAQKIVADDPEALVEELDGKHNMRWNICTEAEEKVSSIYENLVYYAMVPGEEDE